MENNTASEYFTKVISEKYSDHLLPWQPTRRLLYGCGKDKPSIRKKILIAMLEFFSKHGYIPTDASISFVSGKYYSKPWMTFSYKDHEEAIKLEL